MRSLATVLRIGATQLGVATRRQLLAGGVSDHQIGRLVAVGAIEPVFPGVYVVPGTNRSDGQRSLAACLACGDEAAASFGSAATILGIGSPRDEVHVTVPHRCRPRSSTIVIHRTTVWRPRDVVRRGPFVVTSAARTLADLAGCTLKVDLTLLTDEVLRRRLIRRVRAPAVPR